MNEPLPFTGERFVPGTKGEIWIEHWHRYHFAARWVEGRSVVDVACGEGYGSALLAKRAASVVGIDNSPEAIAHAREAYAPGSRLRFECASCTALPLADASVDVAISFETIEHVDAQDALLDELARVVKPEGLVILSCPNRLEYREKRGFENPFHVKELYRDELARLVDKRFPATTWYGQRPTFFSVIAPEESREAHGQLVEASESDPAEGSAKLSDPLYFIVIASRAPAALRPIAPALSVFADRGDWVHRDYEKVMRELEITVRRAEALEKRVAELERLLAGKRG